MYVHLSELRERTKASPKSSRKDFRRKTGAPEAFASSKARARQTNEEQKRGSYLLTEKSVFVEIRQVVDHEEEEKEEERKTSVTKGEEPRHPRMRQDLKRKEAKEGEESKKEKKKEIHREGKRNQKGEEVCSVES